jgi:hypothetical protein
VGIAERLGGDEEADEEACSCERDVLGAWLA